MLLGIAVLKTSFRERISIMIKEWSELETEKLLKHFNSTPVEHLAAQFNRTVPSINCKAYRLGIKTKQYSGWSPLEIERLKDHFPNKTTKILAVEFGRSVNSVRQKAFRLKLRKKTEHLEEIGLA